MARPSGYGSATSIRHPIHSPQQGQSTVLPYMSNPGTFGTFTLTDQQLLVYPLVLDIGGVYPVSYTVHTNAGAGAGAQLCGALWGDVDNAPSILISICSPTAATAANSDITVPFQYPYGANTLAAGRYWIGIIQRGTPSPSITLNAVPATSLHGTVLPATAGAGLANIYVGHYMNAASIDTGCQFNHGGVTFTPLAAGAAGTFLPMVAVNF